MKIRMLIIFLSFIIFAASDSSEVVVSVQKLRGGDITGLKAISDEEIYLLTQGAGVLKSTDGGTTFDKLYSSLSNQTLFNDNFYSVLITGEKIYIGGGSKNFVFSPGFHVSTDGGSTFEYKGLEGININDIIEYIDQKILIATQGLGVQIFENNAITLFGSGIEQANVSKLYFDGTHVFAGTDSNLDMYDSSNQTWDPTSLNLPVIDIASNSSVFIASPNEINETTDFANFNPVAELNLGESFNFTTITYKDPYLYAGIVPTNYENNTPLFHKININTNIWTADTAGQFKNPGIPQDIEIFGDRMWLATAAGFYTKLTSSNYWHEEVERLTAAQLTKILYNEFDNSYWIGGTQGDVRIAFDINGEYTKNDWGLRLGVQINDFEFTPQGTFAVQYSDVSFQENIGDKWARRMNGTSSNGYTSIAHDPTSGNSVLLGFDKVYSSSDFGNQWTVQMSGNFDQVEYSERQDKFYVSDLTSILSSDGSVINFQTFTENVFPLDFAIKDDPSDWKIGLASFDDFYEIDENGNATSKGYNGLPSGQFVEKVTYNSSSDAWEGSYDNKIVELNPTTNIWEQQDETIHYISCLTRGGSTNYSNSIIEDILLVGTLGGGLYASASAVGIDDNEIVILNEFNLEQNFPNPFNPSTIIQYSVSNNQFVKLKIYDILGKEITTLVDEEKPAGYYEVEFDASRLPSGIYFYRLQAGSFIQTKKMILLK